MFAILMSEKMDPFYATVVAFPTAIFSILLLIVVFYWALAVIGLVDVEMLDFDMPNAEGSLDIEGASNLNVLSGIFTRFGLNDIPIAITFSLVVFFGWILSFLAVYFTYPLLPDGLLTWLVGLLYLVVVTILSGYLTGKILFPFRDAFKGSNTEAEKILQGQIAIVRTSRVDENFGEATYADGGAGMIVKIRSYDGKQYTRGDRVVLLEHIKKNNTFKVISEEEFKN